MGKIYAKEVGIQIVSIRESKKITQKQLSEMTNIKQGSISRIESGLFDIKIETIGKICSAMNCTFKIIPDEIHSHH